MPRKLHLPGPAMVVALVALFVALSGTAVAAGVVPLAKRALTADKAKVADDAKKLGGQTSSAIVSQASAAPGPASTAAGLVTIKTGAWSLNRGSGGNFTVTCDAGQKAISGGWSDPGDWSASYQSLPTADGAGWTTNLWTPSAAPSAMSGSVYAICVK